MKKIITYIIILLSCICLMSCTNSELYNKYIKSDNEIYRIKEFVKNNKIEQMSVSQPIVSYRDEVNVNKLISKIILNILNLPCVEKSILTEDEIDYDLEGSLWDSWIINIVLKNKQSIHIFIYGSGYFSIHSETCFGDNVKILHSIKKVNTKHIKNIYNLACRTNGYV